MQQYNSQRGTGQDIWACAALMVAEISQPMDGSQIDVFLIRHYGRVLVSEDANKTCLDTDDVEGAHAISVDAQETLVMERNSGDGSSADDPNDELFAAPYWRREEIDNSNFPDIPDRFIVVHNAGRNNRHGGSGVVVITTKDKVAVTMVMI